MSVATLTRTSSDLAGLASRFDADAILSAAIPEHNRRLYSRLPPEEPRIIVDPHQPQRRDDGKLLLLAIEQPSRWYDGSPGPIATRTTLTVDASGTRFAVRTAEHLRCRARRSLKTYTRWRRQYWSQVRVMPDGRWLTTTAHERRGYYSTYQYDRDLVIDCRVHRRILNAAIIADPVSFDQAYPLATDVTGSADNARRFPASILNRFLLADDVPTLARQMFGVSRYRKDLARAVGHLAGTDRWNRLETAYVMRGLIPADWLVAHLNGRGPQFHTGRVIESDDDLRGVRSFLRQLDQRSLRRLLLGDEDDLAPTLLQDIARAGRMVNAPTITRSDSWRHLHNQLWNENGSLRAPHRSIELDEYQQALQGSTPSGLSVSLAHDTFTLTEWGSIMGNCIGGYDNELVGRISWLGAVHDGAKLIANFEIRAHYRQGDVPVLRLLQLLGRFNEPLPVNQVREVEDYLQAHNVEVTNDYWGAPRVAA